MVWCPDWPVTAAGFPASTPVAVVFANRVGGAAPWRFNGGSAIYEPEGRPLRRAPDFGEHVIVADFDPTELSRVRQSHRMLAERRPDLGGARRLCRG